MKKTLSNILALLLFAGALIAPSAALAADPVSASKAITLLPSAVRTKTTGTVTTGSAFNTGVRSNPGTGGIVGFTRHMQIFEDGTAATNATESLAIQGRPVAGTGTWITLTPATSWTTVSGVTSQVVRYEGPIPAEIRAVLTTGSGTGNSVTTLSVTALLGG
jgi:hypothetical protein